MQNQYDIAVDNVQKTPLLPNPLYLSSLYLFLIFGLNYFILYRRLQVGNEFMDSVRLGATFGLFVFGAWGLFSATLFGEWDFVVSIADAVWGALLFFSATFFGNLIGEGGYRVYGKPEYLKNIALRNPFYRPRVDPGIRSPFYTPPPVVPFTSAPPNPPQQPTMDPLRLGEPEYYTASSFWD